MSLSSFNPRTRDLQRLLVGNASDVEIDGAGRILVPAPLRKFAGLDKDVALVGQGGTVRAVGRGEVGRRRWTSPSRSNENGIPPELEGFSL